MRKYAFGYLLVKLNHVVALLVLLCGLAFVGLLVLKYRADVDAARYRLNPDIRLDEINISYDLVTLKSTNIGEDERDFGF